MSQSKDQLRGGSANLYARPNNQKKFIENFGRKKSSKTVSIQ